MNNIALSTSLTSSEPSVDPPPVQLLDELAERIELRTMMRFGVERRHHYVSTVQTRTRITKALDTATYCRSVLAPGGQTELLALIDNLTINETTFFRNLPQLSLFSNIAIQEVMARKR